MIQSPSGQPGRPVRHYPSGPVPEETFTHSHPSWSSDILYQLLPSTKIHSILLVQFVCLTVLFHNLSAGPLWSSSWSWTLYFILHTILHPMFYCLYNHSLFCCSTNVMSSTPNLSLTSLLGNLSFTLMQHIHLTILISASWSAIWFSFITGQVLLPCRCSILFRTQLLHNLPLIINDTSLSVSNGTNCLIYSSQFKFWPPQLHQHLHPQSARRLDNKTYPLIPALHWHQRPQYAQILIQ